MKDEAKEAPELPLRGRRSAADNRAVARKPGSGRHDVTPLTLENYKTHYITPAITAIMDLKIRRSPNLQFVLIGSDNPYAPLISDVLVSVKDSGSGTLHCYALDLVNHAEARFNSGSHETESPAAASAVIPIAAATSAETRLTFNKWTWPANKTWLARALEHKPKAVFVVHENCLKALIRCIRNELADEKLFQNYYYSYAKKKNGAAERKEEDDPTFNEVALVLQAGYRKLLYSQFGVHIVARLEREDTGAAASAASAAPAREIYPGEKPTTFGEAATYARGDW